MKKIQNPNSKFQTNFNNKKFLRLKNILSKYSGVVVAFSGGVDSTLLLKVALAVLKDRVVAVTVDSPLYPKGELREAKKIARRLKVRHLIIHSDELKNQNFVKNKKTRCYYCKIELFRNLQKIAREYGYKVVEASNKTDLKDFRPGLLAAKKMGVDSPLIKAGLLKEEIRMLARKFGLPNWNKPSMACLASRIPYGRRIKREVLTRISKAEDYLKRFKITQVRVRDHLPIARLEVLPHEFRMILENKTQIIRYLKKLGYRYITLDLEGYKSGSMNL